MAPDYPTNWYGPAIEAGIRPIRLIAGTKQCPGGTWESNILTSIEEVRDCFAQGYNVGFLLQGKGGLFPNPSGVWVLDIDSQAALDRFGDSPFNLMVSRDHPAKRHLYARLMDPTLPRTSRLIRHSHDVKLTGIVVGPGSRHKEGGIYQAFQRNSESGLWMPWQGEPVDWHSLSSADHLAYIPLPKLIKLSPTRAQHATRLIGEEWMFQEDLGGEDAENLPRFTTARGRLEDRVYRGEGYIRNRIRLGIVSKSGNGGRATLLIIATHLLRYLCLPHSTVLDLLSLPVHGQELAWNDLCINAVNKEPYPWSREEILSAIEAAYHYAPAYGVMEYGRLALIAEVNARLLQMWSLIEQIPPQPSPAPSMAAQELYALFLELFSLTPEECSYRRFTVAFQRAIREGVIHLRNARGGGRRKLRYYEGASPDLLHLALELMGEHPEAA